MTLSLLRIRSFLTAVSIGTLLLAACAGPGSDSSTSAPSGSESARAQGTPDGLRTLEELDPVDTREVALAQVPGVPSGGQVVTIQGGEAGLEGGVSRDGEPVEGATVQLQRSVDGVATSLEVLTGPGGYWAAPGIMGGRYMVRAWKEPDLALAQAEAVFLGEEEQRELHLVLVEVAPAEDPEEESDSEDEDEDRDQPETPRVRVGDTVIVPFDGRIPAGTYTSDDPQFCETVYERRVDGDWESSPQVTRGWTINTSTAIRNLRPAPGSEPCTYERTA